MGKSDPVFFKLKDWFERQKRVLPWREDPSPYRVWISEIMLQQTQVVTVIPYFQRFIERFPTVEALASSDPEEVLRLWAGLGYYSRARNLHRGAQTIVKLQRFPENREEWESIPGVGPYTAGAILSIAFEIPEAILDGNVERVLSRRHLISLQEKNAKSMLWKKAEESVKSAYAMKISPSILNQALMELGATICSPKKPQCLLCPIQSGCQAFQKGVQEDYPGKKKRKAWKHLQENRWCVINSKGEILLEKIKSGEWRAGLYDLPERCPKLLQTRKKSKMEIQTRHVVTHHKIQRTTQVHSVKKHSLRLGKNFCWATPQAIFERKVGVGSACKKVVQALIQNNQKVFDLKN